MFEVFHATIALSINFNLYKLIKPELLESLQG